MLNCTGKNILFKYYLQSHNHLTFLRSNVLTELESRRQIAESHLTSGQVDSDEWIRSDRST